MCWCLATQDDFDLDVDANAWQNLQHSQPAPAPSGAVTNDPLIAEFQAKEADKRRKEREREEAAERLRQDRERIEQERRAEALRFAQLQAEQEARLKQLADQQIEAAREEARRQREALAQASSLAASRSSVTDLAAFENSMF